jgi:hypothetical protein
MKTPNIKTLRKYSGYARGICTLVLAFSVAGLGFVLLEAIPNTANTGSRFWLSLFAASVLLSSSFTWLLRRLFDNLAGGEIFSSRNVALIRNIAFVFVGVGLLKLVGPLSYQLLVANGFLEPAGLNPGAVKLQLAFIPGALTSFAVAGILLLASWIMRVGLGVTREADELKRDAELVV